MNGSLRHRRGFSLLEVLLALGIMALFVYAVSALLHSIVDGQTRSEAILDRSQIGYAVLGVLARDLGAMFDPDEVLDALKPGEETGPAGAPERPPGGAPPAARRKPAVAPGAGFHWSHELKDFTEGFSFPSVRDLGGSSYSQVTYAVKTLEGEVQVLFRRQVPRELEGQAKGEADGEAEGDAPATEQALPTGYVEIYDRVVALRFSYLEAGAADFQDNFDGPPLPRAIKIELVFLTVDPAELPQGGDREPYEQKIETVVSIPNAP